MDYALEVCNAVLRVWEPSRERKVIINLPTTVENAMPHVFASQVEYMSKHLYNREHVLLSLHPHNDRGSGVSDAELGILAGADRIVVLKDGLVAEQGDSQGADGQERGLPPYGGASGQEPDVEPLVYRDGQCAVETAAHCPLVCGIS